MKRRLIFLAIGLIILIGITGQVISSKNCQVPKPFKLLSAEQATPYQVQSILGRLSGMTVYPPQTTSSIKNNIPSKVTLINFWASWCRPCRDELPILDQLKANQIADIRLVNIGDDEHTIQHILSELNIQHLSSEMASEDLLSSLSLAGLPATLVWGKNQTVFLGLGKIHNINAIQDWLICQAK